MGNALGMNAPLQTHLAPLKGCCRVSYLKRYQVPGKLEARCPCVQANCRYKEISQKTVYRGHVAPVYRIGEETTHEATYIGNVKFTQGTAVPCPKKHMALRLRFLTPPPSNACSVPA